MRILRSSPLILVDLLRDEFSRLSSALSERNDVSDQRKDHFIDNIGVFADFQREHFHLDSSVVRGVLAEVGTGNKNNLFRSLAIPEILPKKSKRAHSACCSSLTSH